MPDSEVVNSSGGRAAGTGRLIEPVPRYAKSRVRTDVYESKAALSDAGDQSAK